MADLLAAETVATVELFTMGYWLTLLTALVSAVGMFVGLACAINGRRSVRFRPIWIAAAAVAIGGVGVWLASTVSLLGVSIPGTILRYDVSDLTLSMVFAVAAVFLGLMLAGREFDVRRMATAAAAIGVGFGIMLWLQLTSIDIQGSVSVTIWLYLVALAFAVVASSLCVWLFQRFRFPAARVGSILMFAAGVAVFYFSGISSLEFRIDPEATPAEGMELFGYAFPMLVIGLLALAVPITAVLVAPERRDELPAPKNPVTPTGPRSGDPSDGGPAGPGTAAEHKTRPSATTALAQRAQPLPEPAR
ncbi:MHYT domain-containing protein [Nocardia carnea]|uniref:MHYT domain-containing protein n=1 Tax=Nocardia carnea TaxID=37328 RepID=UPI00245722DA|nr:MHYT domain-containing protein [Nocardia carnea]